MRLKAQADVGDALSLVAGVFDVADEWSEKAVCLAVGEEMRRAREVREWSRVQLVEMLPSGIGDRTLLSYEHGTRNLTFLRLVEICLVLGIDPATLVRRALQRARIRLATLPLQVDLRALLHSPSDTYRPMIQWARNTLNEHPDGIVEVEPVVIKNLARFVGCPPRDLTNYLARFLPDEEKVMGDSALSTDN
jgi:transcriptional regulator with XRE-family HTH domain